MSTNTNSNRFDDWEDVVDCNGCGRYYDNTCDGVSKGNKRSCTSYLATRGITIPYEINRLKTAFKWLVGAYVVLLIIVIFVGSVVLWLL